MTSPDNPVVLDLHRRKDRLYDQMMIIDGKLQALDGAIQALIAQRLVYEQHRRDLMNEAGDAGKLVGTITRTERQTSGTAASSRQPRSIRSGRARAQPDPR